MTWDFDRVTVPSAGAAVAYEDDFVAPEAPIVPYSPGGDRAAVSAARRVLDAAAERTGRTIHWMRVYTGEAARERYGDPLPDETVRAFRRFRLGLVGPLAADRRDALALERDLRRRLGLTVAATRYSLRPTSAGEGGTDITLFRDVSDDAAALEYGPGTADAARLRAALLEGDGAARVPDEPAGYSVSPISRRATRSLVDAAVDYAFENDRDTVTVAHQGDLRPASEGSFRRWARDHLETAHGEGVVDEATFRAAYESYPEDELVSLVRRTDELCRDLLVAPAAYDTVLAPALGGTYLSTVAGTAAGIGGRAELALGDGRLLVSAAPTDRSNATTTLVPLLLAGCLSFDYLGWADTAGVLRATVSRTRADGSDSGTPSSVTARGAPTGVDEFADAVVARLRAPGAGGVPTTPEERAAIKDTIAALYGIVFEDSLAAADIELNQLLHEDEEADVSLPEVGLNVREWRRWSVERRIEVLLHELAHVEEAPGERDHGDAFYERFVDLAAIAADREPELAAAFGEPVDVARVYRFVVESVHEETIEPDLETVRERKRWLRERVPLDRDDHY